MSRLLSLSIHFQLTLQSILLMRVDSKTIERETMSSQQYSSFDCVLRVSLMFHTHTYIHSVHSIDLYQHFSCRSENRIKPGFPKKSYTQIGLSLHTLHNTHTQTRVFKTVLQKNYF
jgi:hypothetical protein